MLNQLVKELKNKLLTFEDIESIVNDITNRLEFDRADKDSIFNGDNRYYAFESDSISYEITEDKWLNIKFEADRSEDIDIHTVKVKITDIEFL